MMPVFVDTSAIISFLSPTDAHHQSARTIFERLREGQAPLMTTSYVLVETYALLDRRFGRAATRRFREDFGPLLEVVWVDGKLHELGLDDLLRGSRSISIVDAVSFVCCRQRGIDSAWAFDKHFDEEGLRTPV
jgi:predicted nucleic acid-binding protein